ncbi:MAG: hypothetical protein LBU09_03400 [Endomicrobium sp.]|nr:hypothetical protein [Endomicrobium sp.]
MKSLIPFSEQLKAKINRDDKYGNKIRFPKLKKGAFYNIDGRKVEFKKFDRDLALFSNYGDGALCRYVVFNRRELAEANIEYLGYVFNAADSSGLSKDFFVNKTNI